MTMSAYQGMRWFRCDLQVQTPEDGRHWDRDDPLRLPSPRNEQDLQEKARAYLRRCHEVGLELIGVTDHNFCGHRNPSERFLAHLVEQNRTVAEEQGRDPLWIFPGFEVDIGFHVLCLFPPVRRRTELDKVCDVLTGLGLGPDRRFNSHGPEDLRRGGDYLRFSELLKEIQEEQGGIVIAAHAFGDAGIAKDANRAGDYRNENLLCVEVAKYPLGPREQSILEATSGVWGRSRSPAYIQSSDAKSTLAGPSGEPKPNSLGYRWTWIKMSEPSIEALRQAFLDPGSRIRQKEQGDPRIVRHDRIESLSMAGVAFLEDQEVTFSPGLNCLIGGRGSGKSSLFEYMRFALRREDDPAARSQVERIRLTLSPDSVLRLRWRERDNSAGAPGPDDLFEYRLSTVRAQVVSREVADASTVFKGLNVQIFSQREITEISRRPDFLLSLIDGLVGNRLRALRQEETELREKILHLEQQRQVLDRLQGEQLALEQEVQELDRRWAARSAVQEEQKRHRAAQEADRYLEEVSARTERAVNDLDRWVTDLVEAHPPLGSTVRSWPESAYFESLDAEIEIAKQQLAQAIRDAAARYRERIQDLTTRATAWPSVRQAIEGAEEDFRAACAQQGLRPEDLEQLFFLDQQRKAKSLELEAKKAQAAEIARAVQGHAGLWQRLGEVWREQSEVRRTVMESIENSSAVPKVPNLIEGRKEGERPSLEIRVRYAADREHFLREWGDLISNARFRLGRSWQEIGSDAFDLFLEADEVSPWGIIASWTRGDRNLPQRLADLQSSLQEHFEKNAELWRQKQLVRIQDSVDLVLYRSDGTEAGSLNRKQLSEGQANTAVLMLLLASGDGPILIDQPEDELDSNFIFQQLVPLLREIKSSRQIIVVTHNPNLPVNADAELVYALEARNIEGQARGAVRAQGGLDREVVKQAVLDILEGSREAFHQRREKYHF